MVFRTLVRRQNLALSTSLRSAAHDAGLSDVFNVCVLERDNALHVSFRALDESGQKPFRAYVASAPVGSDDWTVVDLTAHAGSHGVAPVADPKLFATKDGVFATFNTGWPSGTQNDIFIMRVAPLLSAPSRVQLANAERQRIEKNWAFHQLSDGELGGIYSLQPLMTLLRVDGQVGETPDITFELTRRDAQYPVTIPRATTIGSQPSLTAAGSLVLMAHERFSIRSKRAYVGRPVRLSRRDTTTPPVEFSKHRLVHSVASALPRRGVHNRNLLSASYFAGADVLGSTVRLSYGVNDVKFGIAEIEEQALWQ